MRQDFMSCFEEEWLGMDTVGTIDKFLVRIDKTWCSQKSCWIFSQSVHTMDAIIDVSHSFPNNKLQIAMVENPDSHRSTVIESIKTG